MSSTDTPAPLDWQTVFASGDALAQRVQRASRDGGDVHRVVVGHDTSGLDAAGAVAVCRRPGHGTTCWSVSGAPPRGLRLWEFPRGVADAPDGDLALTGARELREETGLEPSRAHLLGLIYPTRDCWARQWVWCWSRPKPGPARRHGHPRPPGWQRA